MKYFIFLFLLLLNCFASFSNKRLVYETKDTAFYLLEKEDILHSELMAEPFLHPYKISQKKLKDIFSGIQYIRSTRMGDYQDYLFSEEELDMISKDLSNVVSNLKQDETVVVVSKYDPIKSVISVHKRTSFILWFDSNGMNVVFGEFQKVVSREQMRSQHDWAIIPEIHLKRKKVSYVYLDENDKQYTFKNINGYPNKRWIIFDLSNLNKYKFKERKSTDMKKVNKTKKKETKK